MLVSVIASGSKGNATLIKSKNANVIVDLGISTKSLAAALSDFSLSLDDLSAVFITHSHIDHFAGLNTFLKRRNIPLFASEETISSICYALDNKNNEGIKEADWNCISPGSKFIYRDLSITPFEVPHDANGAMAYTFEDESSKLGLVTDIGCITNSVKFHLNNCDALVLEMNHDVRMLMDSDRTQLLKTRISSKLGHLSNDQAIEFLEELETGRLKYFFPAHISGDCNDPSCVKSSILSCEKLRSLNVVMTSQTEHTRLVDITC